ncbi:hemin uptake protein HemP [Lysobacter tyrosinilyticus]
MALRPVLHLVQRPVRPAAVQAGPLELSIESGVLLRGAREVLIRHGGEVYRLRHTRNDKLILTK